MLLAKMPTLMIRLLLSPGFSQPGLFSPMRRLTDTNRRRPRSWLADSDEVARAFRDDVARGSDNDVARGPVPRWRIIWGIPCGMVNVRGISGPACTCVRISESRLPNLSPLTPPRPRTGPASPRHRCYSRSSSCGRCRSHRDLPRTKSALAPFSVSQRVSCFRDHRIGKVGHPVIKQPMVELNGWP
jgi:hypothetical protein